MHLLTLAVTLALALSASALPTIDGLLASFYTYEVETCGHDSGIDYLETNTSGCNNIADSAVQAVVLDGIVEGCSVQLWEQPNCVGAWNMNVTVASCKASGEGIQSFYLSCE